MFGVHFLYWQYPEASPSTLGLTTISPGPQAVSISQPLTSLQLLLSLKRVPLSYLCPCQYGLLLP